MDRNEARRGKEEGREKEMCEREETIRKVAVVDLAQSSLV